MGRISCDNAPSNDRRPPQNSGIWSCVLTTLTPLCIRSHFAELRRVHPTSNQAMLPGSSLRGMVRAVAELLAADCLDDPCTEKDACVVCRVFGFVSNDFSWQGKVGFRDSDSANANWTRLAIPIGGRIYHRKIGDRAVFGDAGAPSPAGVRVVLPTANGAWCADAGVSFPFLVDYRNLDPEEYAVLKFALTLIHGDIRLFHMLGYAKALGMGAVTISINDDQSPAISNRIDPFLDTPIFREFSEVRRRRE